MKLNLLLILSSTLWVQSFVLQPKRHGHELKSIQSDVDWKSELQIVNDLPPRVVSTKDIFCNREINFSQVKAVGFDMDYTIVRYHEPAFGQLAFDGAKEKLVQMGYPAELLEKEFDWSFWQRGLIIDTLRGNFLKIDRHKYVRVAYHGFTKMNSMVRKGVYSRSFNKVDSFTEKNYVNMDTLFQIVDAHLYALLIEMKDRDLGEDFDAEDYDESRAFIDSKTYDEMYRDIRAAVDLCHRDQSIKYPVELDPSNFIVRDLKMLDMLRNLKAAGIKTFLLTNSLWEYTSVAMNYLYWGEAKYQEIMRDPSNHPDKDKWMDLFDLVIVGSCKPAFLVDSNLNLFRVNPRSGNLKNTDGIYEITALETKEESGSARFLKEGKVFQGGNFQHLLKLLEVPVGEEIMYVGDHLYSDVLRSKRTLGWRTVMIVPELEHEMKVYAENKELAKEILTLRQLRDDLSRHADELRAELLNISDSTNSVAASELESKLSKIAADDATLNSRVKMLNRMYHTAFHPIWGQMFKAGYLDSRWAFYVLNYACLYTSMASNLSLSSTERSFRTTAEYAPHDGMLEAGATLLDY